MGEYWVKLKNFIYRDFDPVTKGLILISGLAFVLELLVSGLGLFNLNALLSLNPVEVFKYPWTILTYPFAGSPFSPDPLSLIFALLWLWFIGGSLERSLGSRTYGLFLVLVTLLTGLAMAFTGYLYAIRYPVYGLWLILTGLTWAWANLNPHQEMLFWGIIPIKAQWLAWLQALMTFLLYLNYSQGQILFALASICGIAVAYFFRGRNPFEPGNYEPKNNRNSAKASRRSKFRVIK